MDNLIPCYKCMYRPICGISCETEDNSKCKYYHAKNESAKKVRAEAHQVTMTMKCGRCGAYVLEQDHVCGGCGALFGRK